MSLYSKTTCDVCGKAAESKQDSMFGGFSSRPSGWLSVGVSAVPFGTAELKRTPDLCSWACVTVYAAEQALRGTIETAHVPALRTAGENLLALPESAALPR